jgi:hypothetical protein
MIETKHVCDNCGKKEKPENTYKGLKWLHLDIGNPNYHNDVRLYYDYHQELIRTENMDFCCIECLFTYIRTASNKIIKEVENADYNNKDS